MKTAEAKEYNKIKVADCIYTKRFRLYSLVRCLVTFLAKIFLLRDLNCSFPFHSSNVFDTSLGIKNTEEKATFGNSDQISEMSAL